MGHAKHSPVIRGFLLGTSALSLLGSFGAFAQPSGSSVVSGQVSIATPSASNTIITQSTQKALIEWQDFSIAAGGTVQFNQPNSSAITLNRVVGTDASAINGSLLANGQIWLINPNGMLFGNGSNINVGGLLATTSNIANQDFAAGNYNFAVPSDKPGAAIVNQGAIHAARGGSVVLSGKNVSNQGLIVANRGTVVLGGASAFTVDFNGDKLLRYAVTPQPGTSDSTASTVSNSGKIRAAGGKILMTTRAASDVTDNVINNTGMLEATSVSEQNGEIILDAGPGGAVNDSGTIDASGKRAGQTGGTIALTGDMVGVGDGAVIDASGDAGGGNIAIGGNFHGAGPLPNARTTNVGNAVIKANAVKTGNGGNVAIWSDGATNVAASISARGGAQSGNGGRVETSGEVLGLSAAARVDTLAPMGEIGSWLLDPNSINVTNNGNTPLTNGTLALGTNPGQTNTVAPSTIIAALATSNVTLQAVNSITVGSPIIYSSVNTLNLLSQGSIGIFASVQNTLASGGGGINLIAGWNGVTVPSSAFSVSSIPAAALYGNSNNGVVNIGTTNAANNVAVGSASGTTVIAGLGVNLFAMNGYAQVGFHGAGGGDVVVLAGKGAISLNTNTSPNNYAQIGNGSLNKDVSGNITGNILVETFNTASSSTLELLQNGAGGPTWIGNAPTGGASETGNVTLIGPGEDDNAPGDTSVVAQFVAADLGGGDFTYGSTDPLNSLDISPGSSFSLNTSHNLTLLSVNGIYIGASFQNIGTGTITLVGGWNGTALGTQLTTVANAYGNNGTNGGVHIGVPDPNNSGNGNGGTGSKTVGNITVGSAGGTIVLANSLQLAATYGSVLLGSNSSLTGAVSVTTGTGGVTLIGGGTNGAFAQIGNQGPLPANSSGGNISIVTSGALTLIGGAGLGAYVQIGDNGGPGVVSNSYNTIAQIGVKALSTSFIAGSGVGSYAQIQNGGGQAQVASGQQTLGFIAAQGALTSGQSLGAGNINVKNLLLVTDPKTSNPGATTLTASLSSSPLSSPSSPSPIAALTGEDAQNTEPATAADSATTTIANSLSGSSKPPISRTILAGVLRQVITTVRTTNNVHGVPPTDQDFSGWGNEAFWQ